jgi:hypothetical protein
MLRPRINTTATDSETMEDIEQWRLALGVVTAQVSRNPRTWKKNDKRERFVTVQPHVNDIWASYLPVKDPCSKVKISTTSL